MAKDSVNLMVGGAQGIPVNGDLGKSLISYPINTAKIEVGIVKSYNEETGRVVVNNIFDENSPPLDINGQVLFQGKDYGAAESPGFPTADDVQVNSFLPFVRVGEFNSIGQNPSGNIAQPELRQESQDKVSFYFFFSRNKFLDVETPIIATGKR